MDDIKLFAKILKELENLIHIARIHNKDIGMKFGIEKYAKLIIISGKRRVTEGIDLPKQKIRMLGERKTYKYVGIFSIISIHVFDGVHFQYSHNLRQLIYCILSIFTKIG